MLKRFKIPFPRRDKKYKKTTDYLDYSIIFHAYARNLTVKY